MKHMYTEIAVIHLVNFRNKLLVVVPWFAAVIVLIIQQTVLFV